MAITYQSIQSNSATSGTTVVVTKPAGLAVGDLMIAKSFNNRNDGITLPAGFTTIHSGLVSSVRSYITGYKIADSGDVAASNFTFTALIGVNSMDASLIRLTTSTSFPSNPIFDSEVSTDPASTSTPSFSLGLSTGPDTSFLVSNIFISNTLTSSGYTSSPSRTWTERYDAIVNNISSAIATSSNTANTSITNFSNTLSGANADTLCSIFSIIDTLSPTVDISRIDVTPVLLGIEASNTVTADIGLNVITPSINGLTGSSTSDRTQWNNETKPSTEWNNDTL